jgi:hypothetical protein
LLIYPSLQLIKRRRRQHLAVTVMPLLAHDALRFHLLDDTRRAVIADAELTLYAGDGRFAFFVTKLTA